MSTQISILEPETHKRHKADTETDKHAKQFEGYTLDEIRYKLMVNRLKLAVAKEKIAMLTSPNMHRDSEAISGYMSKFGSIMRYVDIAMIGYTIVKKISGVVRFFRPRRK